ncbi:FAD-binding protein [Actinospica durhamensis]|uniref:FAD-binding protein n=1 Tax=Actinospica durhamensis TaxID=1508375 RepID=A0A941EFW2_9ACTN|nr:FAD-dependent monooxygenase [Actinospica durhamensis]MBR7831890.1 FAD-binding protein [Actinospica durhamensis]
MTDTADPGSLTARRAEPFDPAPPGLGRHAVVLGASMSGLLAARVLAEHFDRVTVVERDPLDPDGRDRRGVPQGRHAHGLLSSGVRVLDELFPGMLEEFAADGVPVLRDGAEIHLAPAGHRLDHGAYANPTPVYQPSRPYLEGHTRARLRAFPQIEFLDECEAVGVQYTDDASRVVGARVVRRGETDESLLAADLVVDATGRAGRSAAWLDEMGYPRPAEERVSVDIKYVTQHLRLAPGALGRRKVVIIGAEPGRPTGINFLEQEGGRWVLTMIGYAGHHPPTEREPFLEFIRGVVPPDVYAAIEAAEPLDGLVAHRYPASVRRRYDRLPRFPEGLLVFGDAICSFNPVYGQGMSVAALQATVLRGALARGTDRLAPRFFRAASRRIEVAWRMAAGGDLALPEVPGPRPAAVRMVNAYIARILCAAEHDPKVTRRFVQVSSLLAPPFALLTPGFVLRVLIGGRRGRTARGGAH